MLTFEQMVLRFVIALVLGALLGLERELVGKEAGVRTVMIVTGGASIFAMVALTLPYITATTQGVVPDLSLLNNGFPIIANIVVGIGFLGAGLIIKQNDHPHGVTTAALVWTAAAIGTLVGVGLIAFAATATAFLVVLLYLLRALNVSKQFGGKDNASQ